MTTVTFGTHAPWRSVLVDAHERARCSTRTGRPRSLTPGAIPAASDERAVGQPRQQSEIEKGEVLRTRDDRPVFGGRWIREEASNPWGKASPETIRRTRTPKTPSSSGAS